LFVRPPRGADWLCLARLTAKGTSPRPFPGAPAKLALFDAHDKSRRVGFRPAFPGRYRGSVRLNQTFVARVLFGTIALVTGGIAEAFGLDDGLSRPPAANWVCLAHLTPQTPPPGANWVRFARFTSRPSMPTCDGRPFPRYPNLLKFGFVSHNRLFVGWASPPDFPRNWVCFAHLPRVPCLRGLVPPGSAAQIGFALRI
jgi:hypothetical protein